MTCAWCRKRITEETAVTVIGNFGKGPGVRNGPICQECADAVREKAEDGPSAT